MNEQLHPLTLGEVLDRTAQLYRSRFLVYFGIGVIPAGTVLVFAAAVFVILAWVGSPSASGISSFAGNVVAFLLMMIVGLLSVPACFGATALGWAAMSHAAARAFLGEPISIREAYRSAWTRVWRYLWLCLLEVLLVAVVPAGVLMLVTSMSAGLAVLARMSGLGSAAGPLLGGAIVLLLVGLGAYALWMLLRVCLAFPASVVEELAAWSAIKRGSALSKGTKGRLFLLFLLGSSLGWLLAVGLSFPLFFVIALIPGASNPQHAQTLGMVFAFGWYGLWFAVQAFTKPVYGIALTLFYFDQRIRTEGFDIELMMRKAGMTPEPMPEQQAVPWLPKVTPGVSITALPDETNASPTTPQLHPELPKAGDTA
jgi:hypothetical protein